MIQDSCRLDSWAHPFLNIMPWEIGSQPGGEVGNTFQLEAEFHNEKYTSTQAKGEVLILYKVATSASPCIKSGNRRA